MKNTEFSYEKALKRIKKFGGKPIAIEAQWDGDTNGWFLMMFAIIQKGLLTKRREVHHLGNISKGGDFRILSGQVPPYPESKLAIEIGEKLKTKFNLEFFFPSPNEPDDNCPRWFEKDKAIRCEDCGKLIIPTTSKYLPKEICYHCHLEREGRQKLKENKLQSNALTFYRKSKGSLLSLGYTSNYKSFIGYDFFKDYFKAVDKEMLPEIEIDLNRIKEIHGEIKLIIDEKVGNSLPMDENDEIAKIAPRTTIFYGDNELELLQMGNSDHSYLIKLIPFFEQLTESIKQEATYYFLFSNGLTYRDDSLLRYLNYKQKGKCLLQQFIDHFDTLDINKIEETLKKLTEMKCVEMLENKFTITQKGKLLVEY